MSSLDGTDPEKFEAVPEVSCYYLDAVSGPGSRDSFQGLNLTEPRGGVQMRIIIGEGKDVGLVEEGHEPQGPVPKSSEQLG